MMKKWRCGVCGYVHDGDNPPEKCPKCGAKLPAGTKFCTECGEKTGK